MERVVERMMRGWGGVRESKKETAGNVLTAVDQLCVYVCVCVCCVSKNRSREREGGGGGGGLPSAEGHRPTMSNTLALARITDDFSVGLFDDLSIPNPSMPPMRSSNPSMSW